MDYRDRTEWAVCGLFALLALGLILALLAPAPVPVPLP